jgi:S-adenosylmethionine:tRNA ribosyltransferase-isomerase
MRTDDLNFKLPHELLAKEPRELRGERRDQSNLVVMHRATDRVEFDSFRGLPKYLRSGDLVVLNDSRTLNASLFGTVSGIGRVELQLRNNPGGTVWDASVRPWHEPPEREPVSFGDSGVTARVVGHTPHLGLWRIEFDLGDRSLTEFLDSFGRPIPSPYVNKSFANEYYNNVYAAKPGSSEMPAAGRHFTPELLGELAERGVDAVYLTLHTGLSSVTIDEENLEDHKMYEEWYQLPEATAARINETRAAGGRILGVGTTVMRVLESVGADDGQLSGAEGWTSLYISPGYRFKVVDAFVTNFHGPRSSRIALAAAFTGKDLLLRAYQEAIDRGLQFYEFGDATLTLPD